MLLTKVVPRRGGAWSLAAVGRPDDVLAEIKTFVSAAGSDERQAVCVAQVLHAARLFIETQEPDRTVRIECKGTSVIAPKQRVIAITLASFAEGGYVHSGIG